MTRREMRALHREQLEQQDPTPLVSAPEPEQPVHSRGEHYGEVAQPSPAPLIEPGQPAPIDDQGSAISAATGSHWTAGFSAPIDDALESTFSRQVGSTTGSTNALVLPEIPLGSLTGPVPGTGEIIITGRIDLPASLASTGASSIAHDSPEIDELGVDEQQPAINDSSPVSAMRAVSSYAASREIAPPPPSRGTLVTSVLIVSTIVMAVAAVAIFVVAAANGLF
jgi:hypothetical protein